MSKRKRWNREARQAIKDVAEGKNTKERATLQLSLSQRTIERKVKLFTGCGESCFIHGNTGRPSPRMIPIEEITVVIADSPMEAANFTEISRLLKTCHDRHISPSALRKKLLELGILSPKCKKETRRNLRKFLKKLKKEEQLSRELAETLQALEYEQITGCWKHRVLPIT